MRLQKLPLDETPERAVPGDQFVVGAALDDPAGLEDEDAIGGAILGYAIPDLPTSLLADMMILLVAATIGSAGFQVTRSVALVRLGTHIDLRLQAAVWNRVMRLKTSFLIPVGSRPALRRSFLEPSSVRSIDGLVDQAGCSGMTGHLRSSQALAPDA